VQAIRQRRLPFSGVHMLHVDAHPDLSFSSGVATDAIFEPETLYDSLDESVAGLVIGGARGGEVDTVTNGC